METPIKKLWCRIIGLGERTLFGLTPEGDLVAIPRSYEGGGMPGAERGDIVAFVPRAYRGGNPLRDKVFQQPLRWFAEYPHVIGKRFELKGSDWKTQQEFDSDADHFSGGDSIEEKKNGHNRAANRSR